MDYGAKKVAIKGLDDKRSDRISKYLKSRLKSRDGLSNSILMN